MLVCLASRILPLLLEPWPHDGHVRNSWHSRIALHKTRLSEDTRLICLQAFKDVYRRWSDREFKLIRYSDEKHFGEEYTLPRWVKRKPGEREAARNIVYEDKKKRKHKEEGQQVSREYPENDDEEVVFRLHVWGAVGYKFKSKLIFYARGNQYGKMS